MVAVTESLVSEFVLEVRDEEGVVEQFVDPGLVGLLVEVRDFLVVVDLAFLACVQ